MPPSNTPLWAKTDLPPSVTWPDRPSTTFFGEAWQIEIPADSGLYLIHDLRGPLYVGRTTDLRRRFVQHLTFSHNRGVRTALECSFGPLRFTWLLLAREDLVNAEAWMIKELKPRFNE